MIQKKKLKEKTKSLNYNKVCASFNTIIGYIFIYKNNFCMRVNKWIDTNYKLYYN